MKKQLISQRGFILHNRRSTMVTVNTSGRSNGLYTVIRSTTGQVEKLEAAEMVSLVNELTDEGFSLRFSFGVRVEARVRLTLGHENDQVTASIKGGITLFEGHTGFVIDHSVSGTCAQEVKDSTYSWFNDRFGGKPRLLGEDGQALDFGTEVEAKATRQRLPF